MGKGGMSQGGSGEDGVEQNMGAWLLGVNNLKIQPFQLPPLGMLTIVSHCILLSLHSCSVCLFLMNHSLSFIDPSSSSFTFFILVLSVKLFVDIEFRAP